MTQYYDIKTYKQYKQSTHFPKKFSLRKRSKASR